MNELTTISKSSLPAAPSRDLVDLVDRLSNALEAVPGSHRPEICSACLPIERERRLLIDRGQELEGALVRADEKEIKLMITMLRSAFPTQGITDSASAAMNVKLFVSALSIFPVWAISEACRRVLEGRAGINTAFAPTPPQMAELCREIVAPFLLERSKITALLTAKVYTLPTEEERQRVADGLAALLDEFKRLPDDRKRDLDAGRQEFVDASQQLIKRQLALAGIHDGLPMSLELRAKVAEMAMDQKYEDLVNAAADRRQAMEQPIGGKDEEKAEGADQPAVGEPASAGDMRDL